MLKNFCLKVGRTFWLVPVILFPLFCWGCQSAGKSSGTRFAWVEIQGNTPGQINGMVVDVFGSHGYETVQNGSTNLVFEKKASSWSNFTYGNWGDEASLTIRVKTNIVPVGEQAFMLECQAFMVRDRGRSTEEEIKLNKKQSYQEILDEVAKRLRPPG